MKLSSFLIAFLKAKGIHDIFGVPGDFILGFYHYLETEGINIINTCDEQGAGFAADAYARLNGLGILCVTYGVGAYKVLNNCAQAFAEKSPLVIISGAPGHTEKRRCDMLHHKSASYSTQLRVFSELTLYSARLDDPKTCASFILEAFETAQKKKGPVFIELPRDMLNQEITLPSHPNFSFLNETPSSLVNVAFQHLKQSLLNAKNPVLFLGVEIQRFGLEDAVLDFAHRFAIPIYSTIMAKSVISESHPLFRGVYMGHLDHDQVADELEASDMIIALGVWMSDVNLGVFSSKINDASLYQFMDNKLLFPTLSAMPVSLESVLNFLNSIGPEYHRFMSVKKEKRDVFIARNQKITTQRLFECLGSFISSQDIIVSDVGDCLFSALSLSLPERSQFLAPAYYTSMGFSVPAALAVGALYPEKRCIVLVGDGAFQMTGMELSTLVRYQMNPIIIVLDNGGYGTERPIQDGKFNDILAWNYAALSKVLQAGQTFSVNSEQDLVDSLSESLIKADEYSLLHVKVASNDFSPFLKNLAANLAKPLKINHRPSLGNDS